MRKIIAVGVSAAIISHLLSGVYPFLVEVPAKELGLFVSAGLFYLTSSVISVCALLSLREGSNLSHTCFSKKKTSGNRDLWLALLCFTIAALSYYQGFRLSENKLAFVFMTRLDWLLQIPVSLLFLKEKLSWSAVVGALIAGVGAGLLGWSGNFSPEAALYSLGYLTFSLAAYPLSVRAMKSSERISPQVLFCLRSLFICGVLVVPAWLTLPAHHDATARVWGLGIAAGVCLSFMFWLRFVSLKRIPLSWFSSIAPIQAVVAITCAAMLGKQLPLYLVTGITLVLLGEVLFALAAEKKRRRVLQS